MKGLTRELAEFVSNPNFGTIPPRAVEIVQSGFIDTISTMIAGRNEPVVGIIRKFLENRGDSLKESSILGSSIKRSSVDAALINGTAAHALDFDDVSLGGHPSTVLVPAAMAEGEALNRSGEDVFIAYLVGYEVWADLFERETDQYHIKGWHPTAVRGTIAAAATSAYLHRLNPDQCQQALALAASFSSGLVANFGTMTKPLHAGRAAACGLEAVRLACAGLTASPDAIEHHSGFLSAFSPNGNVDLSPGKQRLGDSLKILTYGLSIKKYPTCYATHRVIDAVLDLAKVNSIDVNDVKRISAQIGTVQASMLRNHSPTTGLEAKFSLEFSIASALHAGRVGLSELSDAFVSEPMIRKLMTQVDIETVNGSCPIEPIFSMNDRVSIHMTDGRKLDSGDVRFARGNAMLPLAQSDLKTKFIGCTEELGVGSEHLWNRLSNLRTLPKVSQIY